MDFIDPILSIASQIYTLVETVKANKKRCRRVCDRVRALDGLVRSIQQRGPGQTSADVEKSLKELSITLESARELIKKYTLSNWIERILNSGSHGDEFNGVNERLNDAFQVLSGALQVEQGNVLHKVFELTSREKQDEVDRKEDDMELKTLLLDYEKKQHERMEAMLKQFENLKVNVEKIVEILDKPSITDEDIRMIKADELKYNHPKKPFMTTPTSEVYRGEYRGFQVAIKRYTEPVNTSPREVQAVFNKEVETMRRFESPNILRMFGICVRDEEGPSPQFLIIMEYCDKGSLRQVLDSDSKLSWTRKARMCLDAANGLYRLHQTEAKSKVHGCINSSKFLVAQGYTVKLGGFELAKTETSLKKSTRDNEIRSLCYLPPQMLGDINHAYSKECEVYSFGIVLWEIATRKKPFDGWSSKDIYQKVYNEKFQEPLPEDCPEQLGELINDCRAYDSFHRPSAGVLVDKLRSLVAQLESNKEKVDNTADRTSPGGHEGSDGSTSKTNLDVSEDTEETVLSPGDPEKVKQQQLVCGEALKTNEFSFTPELLTECGKTSYRFRCTGPGVFQCALTGLVFVMAQEAELLYRTVQWDESLLQSAGKMAAGLPFDIKCSEDAAVCQLHLPHCEIMDALLPDGLLSVVHITDDGMSILEPLEITDTHVVVTVPHLSIFGLVWDTIKRLWTKPVSGQVLLFLRPPNPRGQRKFLYVFLLPSNIPVNEVCEQRRHCERIETTPKCNLIKDQKYSVDCPEAGTIQPPEEEFTLDFGPNFHPSFEIWLSTDTEEVTLKVQDQTQTVVWERKVDLPGSTATETPQRNVPAEEKLRLVRRDFVKKVSSAVLNQLLDKLLQDRVLDDQEMDSIRIIAVKAEKARDLIDTVRSKGTKSSSVLIAALREVDPLLYRELKLG